MGVKFLYNRFGISSCSQEIVRFWKFYAIRKGFFSVLL